MIDSSDYIAICCNEPMRDMGMWPVKGHIMKSELQKDDSIIMSIGEIVDINCQRYNCTKCNRYISIANHQAPRPKIKLPI
jgi:hypothetical protein